MICLTCLTLALVQTKGVLHRPGIDLPYVVYGHGKPVVLISGGPGFTSDYEQGIMKGCKTPGIEWIFLEQRGTPRARFDNGTVKDFAISIYVADFEALRKQLHLQKWNVVGHSWGSMVAHEYIAEHPDKVTSVVFLGNVGPDTSSFIPAGHNLDRMLTAAERKAEYAAGGTAVNGPSDDDAGLNLFLIQLPGYFYSREAADKYRYMFKKGCLVGNTQNLVLPVLFQQHWDTSKRMSKYHGPALALQGRQDLLGESACWKDKLAMPQTQVAFVEKAGHMPWLEQPSQFFATLDGFLGRYVK